MKYTATFASKIKCLIGEDKDKYLSLASLENIKSFIPNIDTSKNHDVLPISFNAAVVNRVNLNDDVINTETALAVYKNFLYKQINIEHKRSNVIGVILTAGFSEFGTDKPLTEDEVKGFSKPFNITLGGVLWRVVNGDLVEFIEDASDPSSENYLTVSASWELGFSNYKLITLPEGQKNIESGETIASAEDVEKLKSHLRTLGGDGKLDEKRIYRMPSENVTPLGIGITEKPAADVKGVATKTKETEASIKELEQKIEFVDKKLEESSKNLEESLNKISQAPKNNVNIEKIKNFMPIKSIADITDENLKEAKASHIADVLSNTISEKSKEWEAQKKELDSQISNAAEEYKKVSKEYSELQEKFKNIEATVQTLEDEKKEREAVEKFNSRMSELSEEYNLDDEVRAALVEEVKALTSDDEAFAKFKKKASVFFKGFKKKEKEDPKGEKKEEAKASIKEVVENAVDKGEKEKANIPNTSTSEKKSFIEQYASAFSKDAFEVKLRK